MSNRRGPWPWIEITDETHHARARVHDGKGKSWEVSAGVLALLLRMRDDEESAEDAERARVAVMHRSER